MDANVIIADDDKNLRTVLTQSLQRSGARVRATATLSTLWRWLEEGEGDVVLCDVNLADGDAIDALPKMRALRPDLQFVLMSAQNTVITALRAEEAGAFEYLAKPFDLREMTQVMMRAQSQNSKQMTDPLPHDQDLPMIGRSEDMQTVYRRLAKILPSDLPVLITGAVGTGKTLLTQIIHEYGPRKSKPLCRYQPSLNPENSIREAFMRAADGTLVVENLEDLLPSEQREFVNAISSGEFKARLVTTASEALAEAVQDGRFRADLYHHLNVLPLELPTLSERVSDIQELAEHFLFEQTRGVKSASPELLVRLTLLPWTGNVKELEATIKRLVIMGRGDMLTVTDFEENLPQLASAERETIMASSSLSETIDRHVRRFLKLHGHGIQPAGIYVDLINQVDRPTIEAVLEYTGGNQIKAAEILGINRNTLRKKIQNLDISVTRGKKLM